MAYLTSTSRPAGDPLVESLSLLAVAVPLLCSCLPLELTVPSKSAKPATPVEASTNPEAAKSSCFTLILASSGVAAASVESMGPALPSSVSDPPPGRLADRLKGNSEVKEKFCTAMSTLS